MVHSGISVPQMNSSFTEQNFNSKMNDVNHVKRNLTLDLQVNSNRRRNKFNSPVESHVLLSPDLNQFNLRSPDIAKMLLGTGATLQTPTPTTMRSLFPKPNDDVEMYESFGSTLSDLSNDTSNDHLLIGVSKSNNISMNNINYDNSYPTSISTSFGLMPDHIKIKEEPQTVPSVGSSPPVSPINMDDQEKIKKDRKKARNREAAAKCRKKKLEKISQLEGKVKQLKEENCELSSVARRLKHEVATLQDKIIKHHRSGCAIMIPS